jgi:small subunit ribosomal protein S16
VNFDNTVAIGDRVNAVSGQSSTTGLTKENFYYILIIMLIIRLQKVGKKHTTTFRVVVTQKTAGPKRKYLELLGNINRKTKSISLNKERILYWISKGAQPSETIHNLLISQGIITGKKIPVHKKTKKKAEEVSKTETPTAPVETPPVETPTEAPVA